MQGVPNLGWAAGLALLGFGAWQQPSLRVRFEGVPVLVVPALFTLTATGLLVYDHFAPLNVASVLLAAATLAVAVLRTALSFREVRQLAESRREALTDDLTGLANRRHFFLRLEEALRHADRRLGVLVLDLDDFKELNDTLGHHAGDLLLEEVAARLPRCVRVHDMLARLGGDEFAVLLVDAGPEEARAAADRVRAAIGRPYELEGIQLALDASVGVALFPDSATTAQGLVQRADVAMYQAKASRSGTELYTESRDARSRERLALSGELRRSIEEEELVLHYQPICDPRTGRPVATEALVRWLHPERGLLMPGDFLDLAERAGTMRDLTLWVMRAAIGQAREWREAGLPVRMSVNLSPQDLLDLRFADDVADALDSVHLSADAVTFEITEDTIMADPLRGMDILRDLGDLGVGLALDDFGTGYSSLAHLKRLPVEELKIDRSFVSRMVEEHDDGVIVRSTIELARSLRLRVVAEGVEDLATWTRLTELGCDLIQGFGVSRPLPAAEATAWLAARRDSVRPAA
jgi:diguanylate cyclase